MMPPLFKDSEKQSFFDQNGFVTIPLLSATQADGLLYFFQEKRRLHATVSDLHHTTTDTGNRELILDVDAEIKSVFVPELEKFLVDFKPLAATYHIKEPGQGSETGLHQDPTFVDETLYCSVNVWVALHDIGEENGNLYFVPGSHRVVHSIRSIPSFPSYYEGFGEKLPQMRTSVPLKKGEAVIFSNATLHGATENRTQTPRLAATLLLCSKQADWLLYYNDKEVPGQLEKYGLDLETFIAIGRGERPKGKPIILPADKAFPQVTYEDFLRKTGKKRGPFHRLKHIFRRKSVA